MKKNEFKVPSLAEVDNETAELVSKQEELRARQSAVAKEHAELEQQLKSKPVPAYRSGVAALLGEAVEDAPNPHVRLKELKNLDNDIETALTVIQRRLAAAKGRASISVCEIVRPEYGRIVKRLVSVMSDLDDARREYDSLRADLEANDVSWSYLTPMSLGFLGDSQNSRIAKFTQDAKDAGYVV